jgi:hypothetical protein
MGDIVHRQLENSSNVPLLAELTPLANLVGIEWAAWQNASLGWNRGPSSLICECIEGGIDRSYRSLERIDVPIAQPCTHKRMFLSVTVDILPHGLRRHRDITIPVV